jgi:thioredoxin 2
VIRQCVICGARNRVPAKNLAHAGRCGACKGALEPLAEPLDADAAAFDEIIGAARVPVLVDFWAEWCGPCKMAAPEVAKAAKNLAGRALVLKVDSDRNGQLSARYGVRSIPFFAVFREGRLVRHQAGVLRHGELEQLVLQSPPAGGG